MKDLRRDLRTILIAVVASAIVAGGPVLAHGVEHALFAHNADQVDGIHATPFNNTAGARTRKVVATNSSGRLPNNIIAKAPAATVADTAKKVASLGALTGRPCTTAGQTGTIAFTFQEGTRDPQVFSKCVGVVTPDGDEPNDTRETATSRQIFFGFDGTLSPAGDVDWFRVECLSSGADNVVVTIKRPNNATTTAVFDGYVGDSTAPSVTNVSAWNVGSVALNGHITLRVHGPQADDYVVNTGTAC